MTRTIIGKFDYEGDEARIEGDSVPSRKMIAKVAGFLKARPLKGKNVVAQIIEEGDKAGWIEHVQELPLDQKKPASEPTKEELDRSREEYNATAAKMAKAGFGQPTPGPAPDTHKEVPAAQKEDDKPVVIEGQIIAVSAEARTLAVKNKDGVTTPLKWLPARDPDFGRLGQWWFIRVVAEKQGDYLIAQAQSKWQKPDDWPARGGASGGRQYQPRNERLILFQNMHTAALNGAMHAITPDSQDYNQFMDMVYDRAAEDTARAMKDFAGCA